jgi:hypothetical protein
MRSKTKNINIDSNNLILKVKNIATKLIVNNSKTQRKKLLKGGAQVKLYKDKKEAILDALISSKELVSLLKITTINKLLKKRYEYSINPNVDNNAQNIEDINAFIEEVETNFLNGGTDVAPGDRDVYDYDLFLNFQNYTKYEISKEMIVFDIFKLFYDLLKLEDDEEEEEDEEEMGGGGMKGGGPADDLEKLKETKYPYKKIVIYPDDFNTSTPDQKKISLEEMLKKSKMMKKYLRKEYVTNGKLPQVPERRGKSKKTGNPEPLIDYKKGIEDKLKELFEKIEEDKYIRERDNVYNFNKYFVINKDDFTIKLKNDFDDNGITINNTLLDGINIELRDLREQYDVIIDDDQVDKEIYDEFVQSADSTYTTIIGVIHGLYNQMKEDNMMLGGAPTKYKSTGQVVYIVYKNKKYKRTIYTKEKGKTKYCKMNNEYILLSKCKIIV